MAENKNYEVKNVKTFTGRDCPGYEATLYENGKKIARVFEEGSGAQIHIDWVDREAEGRLNDYLKTLPPDFYDFGNGPTEMKKDIASFVAGLVDKYEEAKYFRRKCKSKTLIRVKDDSAGQYRVFDSAYTPQVKEKIEKHFGDRLLEIINERFVK